MTSAGVYGRQSLGKKKSIEEQLKLGRVVARDRDWTLVPDHVYHDKVSASRFAKYERDDWPRVREAVRQKAFDILILWESSRGDREPETWLNFLSDCRRAGVKICIIENDERVYDMTVVSDWEALASEGIKNAVESEKISRRVRRGQAGSAEAGRPAQGRAPFGYRRVYDPSTGELAGQVPDPETSHLVRKIFTELARGTSIKQLSEQLHIGRSKVRFIALNPAYIGLRKLNDETYPAEWEPLVEPEVFYAVRRILLAPERQTTRPGAQKYLLSYLATCGVCDGEISVLTRRMRYRCVPNGCVTVPQVDVDRFMDRTMIAYLSQPEVYRGLAQLTDSANREVAELDKEIATLTGQLDQWREKAIKLQVSPESFAVIEAGLLKQISEAKAKREAAQVPAVLRGFVGRDVDVAARWNAAPIPARRAVIREIMTVQIARAPYPGAVGFDPSRLVVRRRRAGATT